MGRDHLDIYRKQGFGGEVGIGRRLALCIVDFVNGCRSCAVRRQQHRGRAGRIAARSHAPARPAVAFSRVVFADDGSGHGAFVRKVPALAKLTERAPANQIVPELAPGPN